ncbi:MAG: S-layer homology domain-containing protein [Oscillospiraceae bacterium]|nr:S-layer homology domain-containing protein [Oscillospiraceae bacterium]
MKSIFRIAALLVCLAALCLGAFAADGETLYSAEYCFSQSDFCSDPAIQLSGIFVTAVPEDGVAALKLGGRTIRAGDILPQDALDRLRLTPVCKDSRDAVLCFQPICGTALGAPSQLTIRIQSGKNETPKAINGEFETYKNISNDGTLTGSDPENGPLTFQLAERPKRGTVKLERDGSYVYTPDKNRVGEDSFSFTVTDDAGNVSQPATVNIRILKPSEAMTFADVSDVDQYEAMWLCEQGLSGGRTVAGVPCFCPLEPVSRAEFLVMAMELKGVPVDGALTVSGFADAGEAAAWMQPYLANAMRRGLVSGEATEAGLMFRPNDPVTGQEAAVILQNLLRLPITAAVIPSEESSWAAASLQALREAGVPMTAPEAPLTRQEAAQLLRQVADLP